LPDNQGVDDNNIPQTMNIVLLNPDAMLNTVKTKNINKVRDNFFLVTYVYSRVLSIIKIGMSICALQPTDWSISTNQNSGFAIRRIFAACVDISLCFFFYFFGKLNIQFREMLIYFCTICFDTNKT
jgi:hypothetical protein